MQENGVEVIMIKTQGGPFPGNRFIPINEIIKNGIPWQGWPPPDEIKVGRLGKYVKIRQSDLPDSVITHPHIARSVEYDWEENQGAKT